jgi:hypothetical protein
MTELGASRQSVVVAIIRVLMIFDTVALLFAAALHVAGARIPLGSAVFEEPQIVPAAIVEGLAGLIFLVGAYAVFAGKSWAWTSALSAHIFAVAGFLLGIVATRSGTSLFNTVYHWVMLVVFLAGIVLLVTRPAQAGLGRGARAARTAA